MSGGRRPVRRHRPARRAVAAAHHRTGRQSAWPRRGHVDERAVGQRRGQVDPVDVGVGGQAAGRRDQVADPRAGGQVEDAGPDDRARRPARPGRRAPPDRVAAEPAPAPAWCRRPTRHRQVGGHRHAVAAAVAVDEREHADAERPARPGRPATHEPGRTARAAASSRRAPRDRSTVDAAPGQRLGRSAARRRASSAGSGRAGRRRGRRVGVGRAQLLRARDEAGQGEVRVPVVRRRRRHDVRSLTPAPCHGSPERGGPTPALSRGGR